MADATLDERTEYFDFVYRVKLYVKLAKKFYCDINDNPKLNEDVILPSFYEDTLAKIMIDLIKESHKHKFSKNIITFHYFYWSRKIYHKFH